MEKVIEQMAQMVHQGVSGEPVQTTTHNEAFKDLTTTETDTMTDREIMWVSQE